MDRVRVAVVGAGEFGRHHLRVLSQSPAADLRFVYDSNPAAATAASEFGCTAARSLEDLLGEVDAAVVAVPTVAHADVGCALLEAGIDVLVEKPIAPDPGSARRLIEAASRHNRILQVGHLEQFNPAVQAIREKTTLPLFFEIHRLSVFTPRSLDIDVVLDLMIHDLDIVLSLVGALPSEIRAAGISILSGKVDIANVRMAFANGCVANLTASRVSVERVRKLRLFQPHQYLSADYSRQEAFAVGVSPAREVSFLPLAVTKDEPLRLELEAFLGSVRTRAKPLVSGEEGLRALEVAVAILDKIEEHAQVVASSVKAAGLGG